MRCCVLLAANTILQYHPRYGDMPINDCCIKKMWRNILICYIDKIQWCCSLVQFETWNIRYVLVEIAATSVQHLQCVYSWNGIFFFYSDTNYVQGCCAYSLNFNPTLSRANLIATFTFALVRRTVRHTKYKSILSAATRIFQITSVMMT